MEEQRKDIERVSEELRSRHDDGSLGSAAHDLNNLLMTIQGHAGIAGDLAGGDRRLIEALASIESTAQQASDVVARLFPGSEARRLTAGRGVPVGPVATAGEEHAALSHRGNGETLLLVEDSAQVRAIIASSLEANGYRVVQAADGEAAMTTFRNQEPRPALVVLDLDLPGRDGLSCLALMCAEQPNLSAVLISGLPDPVIPRELECVGFLPKPFGMVELAALITTALAPADGGEEP